MRPSLLLNFAQTKRLDPRITFTRASTATYFDASGVLRSAASGVARFDHHPTTGVSLGLLVEEARTNSVRNGDASGASAGSPGTMPTNWAIGGGTGLTRTVVGTGTENGVPYVDVRMAGTAGSTFFTIGTEGSTTIASTNGQAWSNGVFMRLVGGSLTGVTVATIIQQYNTGVFLANLTSSDIASTLTANSSSGIRRYTFSSTTNQASITHVTPSILFSYSNGAAIDFTIRIGGEQLEAGAFPTSYIPTTSAAVTRAADSAVMTGTNFSSWFNATEGTFIADFSLPALGGSGFPTVFHCGKDTTGNRGILLVINDSSDDSLAPNIYDDTPTYQGIPGVAGALVANTKYSAIIAYKANDSACALNGTAGVQDTAVTLPTALNKLAIGHAVTGASQLNGHIRRIGFLSRRLAATTNQGLTA